MTTQPRNRDRRRSGGFTLLEVMIAMAVLAIGATSILAVYVAALSFQTERVETNRSTELYNLARRHAQARFEAFDPSAVEQGQPPVPKKIVADLTDYDKAMSSGDPMVMQAWPKFRGFRYEVEFTQNDFAVAGSSVVAHIKVYGLSGQLDESNLFSKEILTRRATPVQEYWRSPSIEARDRDRAREEHR